MRVFVALDLKEEDRLKLEEKFEPLRVECAGIRLTALQNLHVTVRFIGEIEEKLLKPLILELSGLAEFHQQYRLHLAGLTGLPSVSHARVLAVEVNNEEVRYLAAKIEKIVCGMGFAPEQRNFRAHLTLARIKNRLSVAGLCRGRFDLDVSAKPVLFESRLHPQGPEYIKILGDR
ncbi:MAG: RNA 2',3'-cyclic phosphodiesterase [Candidatus Wallbacteria bacterium]|nr:RNA 2',3'-cyclic phosphodiesterase [Candidatus Wallbacteria bacterium]